MKYRWYLSHRYNVETNRTRNRIALYIQTINDGKFSEIMNPARDISACVAETSGSIHAQIVADSLIFAVSPLYDNRDAWLAGLNSPVNNISSASAIKQKLEDFGVNMDWISGSHTLRQAFRYIMAHHLLAQTIKGKKITEFTSFLQENLTSEMSAIPIAVKDRVKAWMVNKGLAINWITNLTTVRQVLHYILNNLSPGSIKMSGVIF